MSDEPASPVLGSVTPADPAPVATPADPSSTPGSLTEINREAFLGLVPEDIRSEKVFQNINEANPIEDLSRQFLHSQKLIGVNRMPEPQADWTDDQWGDLYSKIGRPDTPGDYSLPEIPEGFTLDEEAIGGFREAAHGVGVTSKQFEKMMEYYAQYEVGKATNANAAQEEAIQAELVKLQAEWGDDYQNNLGEAERALQSIGDEELTEFITKNPQVGNNPSIIKLFHRLGRDTQEHALKVGDSTNPAIIKSTEQAKAALIKFESDNAALLSKRGDISAADRAQIDRLAKRRTELYKLAYPE